MDEFAKVELLQSLRRMLTPLQFRLVYLQCFLGANRTEVCKALHITKYVYYRELKLMQSQAMRSLLLSLPAIAGRSSHV
jgi:hypothetical protein